MSVPDQSKPLPTWDDHNLRKHCDDRKEKDPGCLEAIADIANQPNRHYKELVPGDLMNLSKKVFLDYDFEYEATTWDRATNDWHGHSAFYVNEQLLRLITNLSRQKVITLYHIHKSENHCPGPPRDTAESEKELIELRGTLVKRSLADAEMKDFKIITDFDAE